MKIVVTGASRGIGYDAVLALATEGGHELLALSRNAGRLEALAVRVREIRPDAAFAILPFDLERPDWHSLSAAIDQLGGVDVLINNAGYLVNKPFSDLTPGDWQRSFAVNLFGAVDLIRRLLPQLERSDRAHILNIGSMGGFQGSSKFPGLTAYSASKAALANLTECLAEELKAQGIAVNCLALGAVATEMLQEAFPGYQAPLSSARMGAYVARFATTGQEFFNGKILPVSVSTP